MAENHEKQGFTFFAFLPPYIGVSGFLAYPKGKNFSRSIDWYRKFFISCPLARYLSAGGLQRVVGDDTVVGGHIVLERPYGRCRRPEGCR